MSINWICSQQVIKLKQPFCNQHLMSSYMLIGKKIAIQEKNLVCKNIKMNCCRKDDQQRIFHMLRESLPSKVDQYEQKMRMALMKVAKFFNEYKEREIEFKGSGQKKMFCIQQHRRMKDYPFDKLYKEILDNIDFVNLVVKQYYQSFPCILCDYKAHKYVLIDQGRVFIHNSFCQDILKKVRGYLRVIHVDLINLLQLIQNSVDCSHYKYSYDLKFFDQNAYENHLNVDKCTQNLDSVEYMKYCKKVCEKIEISRISRIIQGDFEFLERAVNIFEQLSSYQEEKAQIATKMNEFLNKQNTERKIKQEKLKKQILVSRKKIRRNKDKFFSKLLRDYNNISIDDIKSQFNERVLEEKKQEQEPKVKPILEPKYIYAPELEDFYLDIPIKRDVDHRIYKLQDEPVEFHKLTKTFINGGIVIADFIGQQNIDINDNQFYEQLYSYREKDKVDTKLQILLSDFSKGYFKKIQKHLTKRYKMKELEKKIKKKKKKLMDSQQKQRILSLLQPKLILNENYYKNLLNTKRNYYELH